MPTKELPIPAAPSQISPYTSGISSRQKVLSPVPMMREKNVATEKIAPMIPVISSAVDGPEICLAASGTAGVICWSLLILPP